MTKLKQYLNELAADSLMIFERGILIITVKWALFLAFVLYIFSRSLTFLFNLLISLDNSYEPIALVGTFLLLLVLKVIILVLAVKKNQAWLELVERKRITIFILYLILFTSFFNLDLLEWLSFGPFIFFIYLATQFFIAYIIAIFMNIDVKKESRLSKEASLTNIERKNIKKKKNINFTLQVVVIALLLTSSYYLSNTLSSIYPILVATFLLIIGLVLAVKKQDKILIVLYVIVLIPFLLSLLVLLFFFYLYLRDIISNII